MKTIVILAALVAFACASPRHDDHYDDHYDGYGRPYGGYGGSYGGYYYKRCPKLKAPDYGSVELSGTKPGSTATYSCNEGFTLTGGDNPRKCQKNGKWSGKAPTCEIVDCGAPDPPDPNGDLQVEKTTYLSTATYSCNNGYLVDTSGGGSQLIICQANGRWSDTAPRCIPVDCGYIGSPENGKVRFSPGTTLGSSAAFMCNVGYRLVGDSVSICLPTGWDKDTPVCEKIQCPEIKPPYNVKLIEYTDDRCVHSFAVYTCKKGFKLAHSTDRRKCLQNGEWEDPEPQCVKRKYYGYGQPIYG